MNSSLSMLKQAFSNPELEKTLAMTQSYVLKKVMPPPPPDPVPEEPYQYLPPPGPYSTGPSWEYTFGILGTMAGLSAAFLSLGALLGITTSLCVGKRTQMPPIIVEEQVLQSKDEYEEWAEENYDRAKDEMIPPMLEGTDALDQAEADEAVSQQESTLSDQN